MIDIPECYQFWPVLLSKISVNLYHGSTGLLYIYAMSSMKFWTRKPVWMKHRNRWIGWKTKGSGMDGMPPEFYKCSKSLLLSYYAHQPRYSTMCLIPNSTRSCGVRDWSTHFTSRVKLAKFKESLGVAGSVFISLYVCFIDFKYTFDLVNRSASLFKLFNSGIRGRFFTVVKSMFKHANSHMKWNWILEDIFESLNSV